MALADAMGCDEWPASMLYSAPMPVGDDLMVCADGVICAEVICVAHIYTHMHSDAQFGHVL